MPTVDISELPEPAFDEKCEWCERDVARTETANINGEVYDLCSACSASVCRLCGIEKEAWSESHTHHVSYLFDITVTVCRDCHNMIHHEDGFHDELEPVYSRSRAGSLGIEFR